GSAVADDALAVDPAVVGEADLPGLVRLDHAVLLGHAADPAVALDAHSKFLVAMEPGPRGGGNAILAQARRRAAAPRPVRRQAQTSEETMGMPARGRLPSSSTMRCAAAT